MKQKIEQLYANRAKESPVLLVDALNRYYFSGIDIAEGILVIAPGRALYLTDFRYGELLETHFADSAWVSVQVLPESEWYQAILAFLVALQAKECLIENETLSLSQYQKLQSGLPQIALLELGSAISVLRSIKTEMEIANIMSAQAIAEKAFQKILHSIKVGVSEREIAIELGYQMLKMGAGDLAFETIVASGINSAIPHAKPTEKKFENGDFITMDFGAKFNGYCSDMTRTVLLGKPSMENKELYGLVLKAQRNALKNIHDGITGREADSFAREVIKANGYANEFGHGLGHGVGLYIHEFPRLSYMSDDLLRAGMVVTVEPGIYIKNKMGVRIEDMILIQSEGVKNLTSTTSELIVL